MRILQVVPTYLPATRYGGPIHSVHGLARALARAGHEVDVFTTSVDGDADSAVPHGEPTACDEVRVWYFRSRVLRRLYWAPAMATRLRERIGSYDLVHLHSVFLWPTAMAARVAQRAGVPYVLSPRGMLVPELIERKSRLVKTAWLALIERGNLARAAGVHMTSEQELGDARRLALGLPLPHPFVIENGVDAPPPGFEARSSARIARLRSSSPYALYLGRIHPKKGLELAIEALALADLQLVMCGPDDEGHAARLRQLADARGVSARLHLEPPVHGDDKWAVLAGARFVLLPSLNENFGNVVLEAMAVGRPVIVTPQVGAASIVREAGCGVVCEGAREALADAMRQLWSDPARADALGALGQRYVVARASWSQVADRMLAEYARILARSPARRAGQG